MMYGSGYHKSNYYASNYYREDEVEEVVDRGFAGGGGPSGRQRRLLKQIMQEDEIVIAFVAAFLQTCN